MVELSNCRGSPRESRACCSYSYSSSNWNSSKHLRWLTVEGLTSDGWFGGELILLHVNQVFAHQPELRRVHLGYLVASLLLACNFRRCLDFQGFHNGRPSPPRLVLAFQTLLLPPWAFPTQLADQPRNELKACWEGKPLVWGGVHLFQKWKQSLAGQRMNSWIHLALRYKN